MNLALKDIRFNLGRFVMTAIGIGFLITASIGMVGLYRGVVTDALLVINEIDADLWIVQGDKNGPFAENSTVSADLGRRAEGLAGVAEARRFMQFSRQFEAYGEKYRATITALDFPTDRGDWFDLSHGRYLQTGHFEAIADETVGLAVGDTIRLGHDNYRIVGTTRGMVDQMGDGLLFVSVNDALSISRQRTSEEILLARAENGTSGVQPGVSAILVKLAPGADAGTVRAAGMAWGDVNIISRDQQISLMLDERLWRLRVQLLAFLAVLMIVMTIVISLIIYTMTIEKLHEIAMLKLIGARNSVILSMIAQQSALIGLLGFAVGVAMAFVIFPNFPRRILIRPDDLAVLFVVVALVSGIASFVGINRSMRVRAKEILS